MTFEEILNSEHKHLVEAIEHGSTDPEVINNLKKELKEKTGWVWKD